MADKSHEHRQVLRWAKRTDKTLTVGSIAVVTVIAVRALGGSSVKVWELGEVPLDVLWVVFVSWTFVHAFTAHFFRLSVNDLMTERPQSEWIAGWEDVVNDGGYYVAVTTPRVPEAGEPIVNMDRQDASTWIAHLGAVALFVAMIPWWVEGGLVFSGVQQTIVVGLIAAVTVIVNWLIGGVWAITLSRLAVDKARPRMTAAVETGAPPSPSEADPSEVTESRADVPVGAAWTKSLLPTLVSGATAFAAIGLTFVQCGSG